MQEKQKKILLIAAAAIALSGIFAPMHVKNTNHIQFDCGYRMINFPTENCSLQIDDFGNVYDRSKRAEINVSTLAIEWLGIMIVAGLLFISTKE